jgi:purine-binding chemotaxis protein CheW
MDDNKIVLTSDEEDSESLEQADIGNNIRILPFTVHGEYYCMEITGAIEVVEAGLITIVPNVPAFVKGVMNLRGEIIAIIDLGGIFGHPPKELSVKSRIIITEMPAWGGKDQPLGEWENSNKRRDLVGLVVDEINDILDVDKASILSLIATIKGKAAEYTTGQIKQADIMYACLDIKKVLGCEDIRRLMADEI